MSQASKVAYEAPEEELTDEQIIQRMEQLVRDVFKGHRHPDDLSTATGRLVRMVKARRKVEMADEKIRRVEQETEEARKTVMEMRRDMFGPSARQMRQQARWDRENR